jgi:hypothetical protein
VTNIAGVKDELQNNVSKAMTLLKRDMEKTMCSANAASAEKTVNNAVVPYKTRGLDKWLVAAANIDTVDLPAAASNFCLSAAQISTVGTAALTETVVQDILTGIYSQTGQFKDYDLPKPEMVYRMSPGQLNLLSPAEKFDVVRGKLDFPTAKFFRKKNPGDGDWWRGLCNGWTQASLHFDEPNPIVFTSPVNGIRMPFGSSDIKGLLAYYYAYLDRTVDASPNPYHGYLGRACRAKDRILMNVTGACTDMNAASFHIAVTNEIGIRSRGMAMDRDPDTQVWNQPLVGFKSKIMGIKTRDLSKNKTEGTVREVNVETTVKYVNELYDTHTASEENDRHVAPQYQPLGPGNQHYGNLTYRYVLELDAADRIIGGEWIGGDPHPDFIWRQAFNPEGLSRDTKNFKDDWTLLDAIVKMATPQ